MTELNHVQNDIPIMDWDDRERFHELNRTLYKIDRNNKLELCDTTIITGLWCLVFSAAFAAFHYFGKASDAANPAMGFFLIGMAMCSIAWVRRRLIIHRLNWHQN